MQPSLGTVGDAYDNAMCESFFASLEKKLIARRTSRSHAEGVCGLGTSKAGTTNVVATAA
jgi:transposase InsO family protein